MAGLFVTQVSPECWHRLRSHFLRFVVAAVVFGIVSAHESLAAPDGADGAATGDVVEATLNGLTFTIDNETGSIVGLEYPGPGKILQATPARSGIVDVAYPIPEFEALRLASRYSEGTRIKTTPTSIVISWDQLGSSRPYFPTKGNVSATVWLTAMPDGRSISMKCEIKNGAELPVGQVLFPDLHGLLPVDGKEGTYFRTCGFVRRPFLDVGVTKYPEFYAAERGQDTRDTYEFTGGEGVGNGNVMIGRWLDYGGLNGGISLYPVVWDAPATKVRIFRLEKDPLVRLAHVHEDDDDTIEPGQTWTSPEYVLTPHRSGWAKGIEPYRAFVHQNMKRMYPMPKHVREGLGFRTIYMSRWYPADGERDRSFTFAELPEIAQECKDHGLTQLVVWHWVRHFILPIPDPYPNLGTPEELSAAIEKCHEIGVNVSLAISISSIGEPTASRYGLKVGGKGWTYHPEMIPRFQPPYTKGRSAVMARTTDPRWEKDATASVKNIYENYTHSITWDQAHPGTEKVIRSLLPLVKETDPRATFGGELHHDIERLGEYFDHTWNWQMGSWDMMGQTNYRDIRGFNSAFPAPRINHNINRNAQDIKYAFMDNNYVNIMPSAPDSGNGTAWIKDYPEVSDVLKQCAGLRGQFLDYFANGTLIGESLLTEPAHGAHVSAYLLPGKVLMLVMNTAEQEREIHLKLGLTPWADAKGAKYSLQVYNGFGKQMEDERESGARWEGKTEPLGRFDLAVYEFFAR